MMEILFNRANEIVIVRISGNKVEFGNTVFGSRLATIDGLKLDYNGAIREFPDLDGDVDWRVKAIDRFKKHIIKLGNENAIGKYCIEELKKHGYVATTYQKQGGRAVKIR